jgi:hypothetical protein
MVDQVVYTLPTSGDGQPQSIEIETAYLSRTGTV